MAGAAVAAAVGGLGEVVGNLEDVEEGEVGGVEVLLKVIAPRDVRSGVAGHLAGEHHPLLFRHFFVPRLQRPWRSAHQILSRHLRVKSLILPLRRLYRCIEQVSKFRQTRKN